MFGLTTLSSLTLTTVLLSLASAPRALDGAVILADPLSNGTPVRCGVPCNLLISDLNTFTLPATLCGPVVLTAADNCYKCLAAVGFSVNALQRQIDSFISSCNAGSSTSTLPGQTIEADSTTEGESESSDDTNANTSAPGAGASATSSTTGGAGGASDPAPTGDNLNPKPNSGARTVTGARTTTGIVVLVAALAGALLY
ncbi:hypothetical protein DFH08DRAFT_940757 [Mycena albidolilacea]|uniref:Elicitin-like protein n=1 Tax=Mycena albidolilacea TaxID=1033008 RepID=A0AAD7EK08_9AGAR|nr:hypothetical protein DFH08DRAFT_940757 [Mycena albidolilacea]